MSENLQVDTQQVILCDMCTEEDREPARKTCMKCEISMCGPHLQAHMATPVLLQTHPLTEPMDLSANKCPQHGKPLEYYCLDDMICVCVSCAIEDQHRVHNMKTFSTAHRELTEKLKAEKTALKLKIEDKNLSLEKWEKSEKEKLGSSSLRLVEAVTKMRDMSLTSVRNSVSARMVSIKTSESSIRAAQKEKDTFRFLQMYSQVHDNMEKAKAVDLRRGLEPGSERNKLLQEIRKSGETVINQAGLYLESILTFIDPAQKPFSTGPELIFEPHVFGPGMSLSKDNRKVFYSSWLGQCSATLLIGGTQAVSNIQRWLVSLPREYDWTIGLCDKSSASNLKAGPVYGLCCKNNQLSSLWTDESPEVPSNAQTTAWSQLVVSSAEIKQEGTGTDEAVPPSEAVEVYWDFPASSLSFIRRSGLHQREEIVTIDTSLNKRSLVPFVQLRMDENAQGSSGYNRQQCSCGAVYRKKYSEYSQRNFKFTHQTNCSCGQFIGTQCITEVVCELL